MEIWLALKAAMGIRVSAEEEFEGLDIGEHGITAYPDFQLVSLGGLHTPPGMPSSGGSPAYARTRLAAQTR